jgi:hypothetical protein
MSIGRLNLSDGLFVWLGAINKKVLRLLVAVLPLPQSQILLK